uniref:Uncharacterized protein n=1 Tax=Trichogramma kaykai TaxID=54128 RepID=A0ABD2XGH1_9HYME
MSNESEESFDNQKLLEIFKSLRENVHWEILDERRKFIHQHRERQRENLGDELRVRFSKYDPTNLLIKLPAFIRRERERAREREKTVYFTREGQRWYIDYSSAYVPSRHCFFEFTSCSVTIIFHGLCVISAASWRRWWC